MTKNAKYLLIILGILLLAAFWLNKGEKTPAVESDSTAVESDSTAPTENNEETEIIAEERLELLRRLKNLRLDTSILQDEKFKALLPENELVKIPPPTEAKPGRTNPFLAF